MNCTEFHEVAAAYALDALDEPERLAAVAHLEHEGPHEGCEELVARHERTAARLARALDPVPVPRRLWALIEARLGLADANLVKLTPGASRWREGLAWAAAAAALLGALYTHQTALRTADEASHERGTLEESLANTSERLASIEAARSECANALRSLQEQSVRAREAVALLELPTTEVTPMGPAGAQTYRATALYNAGVKRALVVSTSIPKIEGKDYELWVIAGSDAPKPAGFVRFDASGVAVGEFDAALLAQKPAAFAISLEPAGGRPVPTEVVLVGKLAS